MRAPERQRRLDRVGLLRSGSSAPAAARAHWPLHADHERRCSSQGLSAGRAAACARRCARWHERARNVRALDRGAGLIHVPGEAVVRTGELLTQRLELVHRWYEGMVNPSTGMLEYLYMPETAAPVREKSPIRDIASVWDAEMLGDFLNRGELRTLAERSLRHYGDYLVERDGYLILEPRRLHR